MVRFFILHPLKMSVQKNEVVNSIPDKIHNNADSTIKRHRCQKCFITHYPFYKFCRWAETKLNKKDIPLKASVLISEKNVKLINDRLQILETFDQKSKQTNAEKTQA